MRELALILFIGFVFSWYFVLLRRLRNRRIGSAAIGSLYDMLEKEKQAAVEMLVEQKAEEQDPETADASPSSKSRPN